MPDAWVIRPATTIDATALDHIHAACFAEAWSAAEVAEWLAIPSVVTVAAFESKTATGFVLAQAVADQAEILTFALHPDRQRQGIGRALLDTLELELSGRGTHSLYLDVAEDNIAALALYRGAGFAETTRRRGYYARQFGSTDAIVMVKSLGID